MDNPQTISLSAVAKAVADIWEEPESGTVDSSKVRVKLEQEGYRVPDYGLAAMLTELVRAGEIRATAYLDDEAARIHGGMVITEVDVIELRRRSQVAGH